MQRIVTLENNAIFELPSGEFTVDSIDDLRVALRSDTNRLAPLTLIIGKPCQVEAIELTYIERHENCAHIRLESNKRFIASEMSVGNLEGDGESKPSTVVVIAHR